MKQLIKRKRSFSRIHAAMLSLLLLPALVSSALAQNITTVFSPPQSNLVAGRPSALWLCAMNNSSNETSYTFAPSIDGILSSTAGFSNVILVLNPEGGVAPVTIPPAGFVRKEYLFAVPVAEGRYTLTTSNYNPVVFVAQNDKLNSDQPPPPPATTPAPESASKKSPFNPDINQFLTRHLSTYEPIYFILGSYPAAEFQFSLKYQLFSFSEENNFAKNALDHFYFGFTQTSLWDLLSRDPSFYDTSYKPSLFLYYTNILANSDTNFFHLDLQAGSEHESNGQGSVAERSMYTAYLQPTANFSLPENLTLSLQPRARTFYLLSDNNPDIIEYRGYVDLLASLTWADPRSGEKIQFATKYQIGDAGRHAGYKFDLRFNLASVHWLSAFNPTIQVQYFTGYGQSLRQYNESSRAIRAGLCLWFF